MVAPAARMTEPANRRAHRGHDDEEKADVFSRQRDIEAIELMEYLLKQRAEKLESKRVALCMRGEALGIQSALLERLKRLEWC